MDEIFLPSPVLTFLSPVLTSIFLSAFDRCSRIRAARINGQGIGWFLGMTRQRAADNLRDIESLKGFAPDDCSAALRISGRLDRSTYLLKLAPGLKIHHIKNGIGCCSLPHRSLSLVEQQDSLVAWL